MDDVIIVGGGPTGFVTALGLAQNGVKVRIIEAEDGIPSQPRAPVYHWSVLEGLHRLGVLEDCLEIGVAKKDYTWLVKQTGEIIENKLKVLEGRVPFPFNMHLGQHHMAGVVRKHLERHSTATVQFGTRCTGVTQDAEGVTVSTDGKDGPQELRARYVVGTDGAGSVVRKSLGVDFPGMTWPERFVATNIYYDFLKWGYSQAGFVIDDQYGVVYCVIDRHDLWRCTYMEDSSLPIETYQERIPEAFAHILPGDQDYRIEASSPYRMHQRSAETYRRDRVLLAGDAAHSTNPTGGFGLTSGLFDSYALVPALSAVVLEGANPEVLDRYAADRKDKFENIASPQASFNKKLVYHACGSSQALEETLGVFRRLRDDPDFQFQRLMFTKSLESKPLLG